MNKRMICGILAVCLSFGTVSYADNYDKYDGMQFAAAGNLLIARRGTYTISPDWIYEGVVMDKEGKFPQKKYTLVKDLDEYILYGNRDIYEEMKARVPFLSKESFKSTFSNQDMAQIIASASGGETAEVDYGPNHYYETITTQQVEQNGKIEYVTSIIDFFFEEDYLHSFSFSYKNKTDGLGDYKAMLASFKLGVEEEKPKKSKQEQLLEAERQEQARKEQERLEKEKSEAVTSEPTPSPMPTVEPSATPEPTPEPIEVVASGENNFSGELIETIIEEKFPSGESELIEESGEEIDKNLIESGETISEPIIENEMVQEIVEIPQPVVTEVRKPTKKKSTLGVILSIPAVRRLIVFCIVFDVTITLIIKRRKKRKLQDTKEKEEYSKREQSSTESTDDKK